MNLIVLLVVIAVERYAGFSLANYFSECFKQYYHWLNKLTRIKAINSGVLQAIVVLGPLLFLVAFVQHLLGGLFWGVVGFVFALMVVSLCLRSETCREKSELLLQLMTLPVQLILK